MIIFKIVLEIILGEHLQMEHCKRRENLHNGFCRLAVGENDRQNDNFSEQLPNIHLVVHDQNLHSHSTTHFHPSARLRSYHASGLDTTQTHSRAYRTTQRR